MRNENDVLIGVNDDDAPIVPQCRSRGGLMAIRALLFLLVLVNIVCLIGVTTFGIFAHLTIDDESPLYISPIPNYAPSEMPGTYLYQPCVYPLVVQSANAPSCEPVQPLPTLLGGVVSTTTAAAAAATTTTTRPRRSWPTDDRQGAPELCCPVGYNLDIADGYCILANTTSASCDRAQCLSYLQHSTTPVSGYDELVLLASTDSPVWLLVLFVVGCVLLLLALLVHYALFHNFVSIWTMQGNPARSQQELAFRLTCVVIMAVVLLVLCLVPSAGVAFQTTPNIDLAGEVTASNCFAQEHTLYFWVATYLGTSFTFALVLAASTLTSSILLGVLMRPCCCTRGSMFR
jgi:hypothetical protein